METKTYTCNYFALLKAFDNSSIHILDINKYFNNSIVKQNFGIEKFEFDGYTDECFFTLKDPKKFFLKIIKYGL